MSYEQRSNAIALMCSILFLAIYSVNVLQMNQEGRLDSIPVFSLWATLIVVAIIVAIVATILITIIFTIIVTIQTHAEEDQIIDERDHLIGLKGTRNAFVVLSVGVLVAMVTFMLGSPPLVMFNVIAVTGFVAEIVSQISRLYLYQKAG
jgi:hypothetical protein